MINATRLDLIVENQNLRKMVEIMLGDIDKNCVDRCQALVWMPNCQRCVFAKYRKEK